MCIKSEFLVDSRQQRKVPRQEKRKRRIRLIDGRGLS